MDWACMLALGLLFAAPPVEEINRAAAQVLEDDRIQSRYPGADPTAAERETTALREARRKAQREREQEGDARIRTSRGGQAFASVLLWVAIAVGVLLVVFWLGQRLTGFTADLQVAEVDEAHPARAPPPQAAIGDAEALAREGRYTEAIHALLLLALQSLARRTRLAGSLTSREILREVDVPPEAKDAVGGLVHAVEISLFGGRAPGEPDYRASLERYERFAAACDAAGGAA